MLFVVMTAFASSLPVKVRKDDVISSDTTTSLTTSSITTSTSSSKSTSSKSSFPSTKVLVLEQINEVSFDSPTSAPAPTSGPTSLLSVPIYVLIGFGCLLILFICAFCSRGCYGLCCKNMCTKNKVPDDIPIEII